MEDIYKLIDDINLQKLDNLDTRVNEALSSPKDDALFILGETLYNYGLMPQGLEVFRTLYHKYPDESELLIYFIEGLMAENQTDEALEYLNQVELPARWGRSRCRRASRRTSPAGRGSGTAPRRRPDGPGSRCARSRGRSRRSGPASPGPPWRA